MEGLDVTQSRPDVRRPPLERARELACLDAELEAAAFGQGTVVVIEGPPGIGKSRLIEEAAARAQDLGMEVLRARGSELEQAYAWGLVLRLFEERFMRVRAEERESLFQGRAALATALFAVDTVAGNPGRIDEFSAINGLYWALTNLSEVRPVALIVDDAHWADEISLRFLNYLGQRIEGLPVALVLATRQRDRDAETMLTERLIDLAGDNRMRLSELSLEATRELLKGEGVVDSTLSDGLVEASWEVTLGTPFLLHELALWMREESALGVAIDPERLRDFAPESVGRSVMLRLRAIGDDAVPLARAVATLGDGIPLSRAARLCGLEPHSSVRASGRLVEARIFDSDDPVGFAHPMIRSAVRAELPVSVRRRYHTDAAELLFAEGASSDQIAPHLLAGEASGDSWPRDVLQEAAQAATRKGAPGPAMRFLRRAIEFGDPRELPPDLLIDLGYAEAAAGETTSLSRFEQAVRVLQQPEEKARALFGLGHTLSSYGRHVEAAEVFQRGRKMFEMGDPGLTLDFDASLIGASLLCAGNPAASHRTQAMIQLEQLMASITPWEPQRSAERLLLAVSAVQRLVYGGSAETASELARSVFLGEIPHSEDAADRMAMGIAVLALISGGKAGEARAAAEGLMERARETGNVLVFGEASALLAFANYSLGRINEALADARSAVETTQRGWRELMPIPHAILARCLVEQGEYVEAEMVLDEVLPQLDGTATLHAFFYWARADLRQATQDARGAIDDFRRCADLFGSEAMAPSPAACPWRVPAALAVHSIGDDVEALRLVSEELALAQRYGLRGHHGAALRAKAVLGAGDPEGLLREAVRELEEMDMPLDMTRTLLDLAAVLRERGGLEEARKHAKRALDLAHRAGASVIAERARKELLACGGRPRRAELSGAAALTPMERRVASLASQGLANRQIAETLFVARTTVEWHLRNVFTKLGIRGREEIKGITLG